MHRPPSLPNPVDGVSLAKTNYRHLKNQKESARKARQAEKQQRRVVKEPEPIPSPPDSSERKP